MSSLTLSCCGRAAGRPSLITRRDAAGGRARRWAAIERLYQFGSVGAENRTKGREKVRETAHGHDQVQGM